MVIFGQNGVVWYPYLPLKSWKNFPKGPLRLEKKSFWYFFDHQWSERSCFKKIIQNFFSSRKVTFGHFFEKNFCPRWQVENSRMTLKFWALRSKGVKTSLGARITLIMTHGDSSFMTDGDLWWLITTYCDSWWLQHLEGRKQTILTLTLVSLLP